MVEKRQKKPLDHGNKKVKKAAVVEPVRRKPVKKVLKVSNKSLNHAVCVPTSILDGCSNLSQITYVVYQLARTLTLFNVTEVVVLDLQKKKPSEKKKLTDAMLLASLLQYFVTPPYLIKSVFKKEYLTYFKEAAKLPRLSALPFMRYPEEHRYREGLAIRMSKPDPNSKKEFKQTKYVNVGNKEPLELKAQLVPINVRVTVDTVEKKVVSPEEAYGDYVGAKASYGYHVRIAKSFAELFTASPFPQGYSQTVWCNSGDFYYDENTKKQLKVETRVPRLEKIIRSTVTEGDDSTPTLLLVLGKWDHISKSFQQSRDLFEGCEGAYQFFDGQLELPGAVPQGNITIPDSCTIAMTMLSTI
ncbi:putative methyltransferase [Nakaseomyces bracarensis]|uniref:putative methyltransferase n=1 Tax=Nakaseomyces bracarensis TaxID=273131 RepID=UPI0038717015